MTAGLNGTVIVIFIKVGGPLGHGVHWDTPSNRKSPTYRAHEMQFPGCSGTPLDRSIRTKKIVQYKRVGE